MLLAFCKTTSIRKSWKFRLANMGHNISWVKTWDGQAIYIDEKLVLESEEIYVADVVPLMLHQSFDGFNIYRANNQWLDEIGGDFPIDLRSVVLEDGRTIAEHWETE